MKLFLFLILMISARELMIWSSVILNYVMFDELILFGVYREHNQVLVKSLGILYIIMMPTLLYYGCNSNRIGRKYMACTTGISGLSLYGFLSLMWSSKCNPILMPQIFVAFMQTITNLYCALKSVDCEKEFELDSKIEDEELLPRYTK